MCRFIFPLIIVGSSVLSHEQCNENRKQDIEYSPAEFGLDLIERGSLQSSNCSEHDTRVILNSKINNKICQSLSQKTNSNIRERAHLIEQYDTLTQNDTVRKQYSTLPYPAVSQEDLAQEKEHYKHHKRPVRAYGEIRSRPAAIPYALTLEAINHFLFNGKNLFR